jgi:NitT/TauT family transport system ATP-binding protein
MNSNNKVIVDFDSVHHEFNGVPAVENLTLKVTEGERLAILGRTGAGKSTLLNLLIGNLNPTSGTVRIAGKDPYLQHNELRSLIGMAFQTPRLLPWRRAADNVAVGQEILRVPKADRMATARRWLDKMHLSDSYEKFPNQLSGGMRQRVSLARAFAIDPALILLDESFSALDEVTARTLREDFVELAEQERKTALIVTHNIEEAFAIATRVIVLGRPAKILAEFHTSSEPKIGTTEFTELRQHVRDLLTSAQGGISARG